MVTEAGKQKTDLVGEDKKKQWKRTKKGAGGASQPAPKPIQAQDGPSRPKDIMGRIHIAGMPMLSDQMLKDTGGDMRSLNDGVLTIERRLL